jgi:hypothetical protein
MSKEVLYPHIKHSALSGEKGLDSIYEAHGKEVELIGQFQQGLLSPTEMATEAEMAWKRALSKIIQERSKQ